MGSEAINASLHPTTSHCNSLHPTGTHCNPHCNSNLQHAPVRIPCMHEDQCVHHMHKAHCVHYMTKRPAHLTPDSFIHTHASNFNSPLSICLSLLHADLNDRSYHVACMHVRTLSVPECSHAFIFHQCCITCNNAPPQAYCVSNNKLARTHTTCQRHAHQT